MMPGNSISDDRFVVTYRITGSAKDALDVVKDICIEQTVEFPEELITDSFIREKIFGRIESFTECGSNQFRAEISFLSEIAASEFTQFLNVILGNISLKPGIVVEDLALPQSMLCGFKGPAFGVEGIRSLLDIYHRPLVASAIKPMGMNTGDFAILAKKLTAGGIDIIKDDHGLSNQSFSTFKERVRTISDIVNSGRDKRTLYLPNVTAPFNELAERAWYAKECGAGGVLISPALSGFDSMKYLADSSDFNLPIMSHPAFIGSFLNGGTGFTHGVLLGKLMRLAGADITVYPNFGGRFSFTREQCLDIVNNCRCKIDHVKKILPAPGGGMNFSNIPEMTTFYGVDTLYLMGGGLFKRGADITGNCHELMNLVSDTPAHIID